VNIVTVVDRVRGDRGWIKGNRSGDVVVGCVEKENVFALEDAVPYFTSLIERNASDWDAYLRRADAEHAQNKPSAAIADYSALLGCAQTNRSCIPPVQI
jgi:hypothetical protein